MDAGQAQRFLAAARKGYAEQVEFFIAFPDRQAQREAVLAAQQVVELARREVERVLAGFYDEESTPRPRRRMVEDA